MENPTILILDDDAVFLDGLADVLSSAGYEVVTAADMKGAERILTQRKIDVFIVNPVLSGLGGFEVIEGVRRKTPSFRIIGTKSLYQKPAPNDTDAARLHVDAFVEKSGPGEPISAAMWIGTIRHLT